jgi:hypothetical protein
VRNTREAIDKLPFFDVAHVDGESEGAAIEFQGLVQVPDDDPNMPD